MSGCDARDVHEIRWGYNLADLEQLTRAAVARGARSGVTPMAELHDAAWSAIAEHLLTAGERPSGFELIGVGMRAISDEVWAGERAHGWDRESHKIRPSFATWWLDVAGVTGTAEDRIVDSAALWQIWTHLSPGQRDALLALAACEDYRVAAASLGLSYKTFHQRVRTARSAFLALWHEGETPSRVWSADRRRWRDGQRVQRRRLRPDQRRHQGTRPKAGSA